MRSVSLRALAGATVATALVATSSAFGALPAGNVLQNPGADAAVGAANASAQVPVPQWSPTATFTSVAYGAPGGFPNLAASTALGGGANFFAGGSGSDTATGTQTVALAGAAAEIDAGAVKAALSGLLGGFESQGDTATLAVSWLNSAGTAVGTPLTIGPVTEAERANVTTLLPRSATAGVPNGTRSASVVLTLKRVSGSYNDGYADNLSLTLISAPLPPVAKVISYPSAKTCASRRKFRIRLRRPKGLKISSATVYVNGKRVKVVKGKRVTAPVNLTGLPKGRFVVRITIRTADGRTLKGSRRYRTCTKKRARSRPRL